jgi:hypothetical protein
LRSAAIAESAVMRPVFGIFRWDVLDCHRERGRVGIDPDLVAVARHVRIGPDFDRRAIGPMPASDSAATTLTLAGNAAARRAPSP